MPIYHQDPKNARYTRWCDPDGTTYNVWYSLGDIVDLSKRQDELLPAPLVAFLEKWTALLDARYESFREEYPVKNAHIEFIYAGEVYRITPHGLRAMYREPMHMMGMDVYVECDAILEYYQNEIRADLEKTLGVVYSRYYGYLG